MTASELTKEIYDKYPKVWDKIKDDINGKPIDKEDTTLHIYLQNGIEILFRNPYGIYVIPFSMLYGLLDDFFKEYNIFLYDELISIAYEYSINNPAQGESVVNKDSYDFFKQQAILKACEILEEQLNVR
jgi:hypothetical protein